MLFLWIYQKFLIAYLLIYLSPKWKPIGFSEGFLTFLYSCLKCWKQSLIINNVYSMFQTLHSSVAQVPILGPLLFNIFLNGLFYFIKDAQLLNFANDNTIATFSNSVDLEKKSGNTTDWFRSNETVVNPG